MEDKDQLSKSAFIDKLDKIKELQATESETYAIAKDRTSGQHYLWYSLFHMNLSEGRNDQFEHFLPLDSDDVLGFMFGEEPYVYPTNWQKPYLRTGTDDRLMWFDPTENFNLEQEAQEEHALLDRLLQYKQQWMEAKDKEELTRKFFADLDDLKPDKE
ncbi:UNVERIFIED_CONTAM: hypothetical protein ABID98_002509 [Brevibacillus sp. OAP136]